MNARAAAVCALVLLVGAPSRAQTPRLLTVDDLFTLRSVGDPRISPDGTWVAYTVSALDQKEDASDTDIYMAPFAGGTPIRVTSSRKPESSPRWSPDGRYLAFLSAREGKKTQVWLLDRRGGEAVRLTDFKSSVASLVWSPDSARLALTMTDPDPDDPDLKADAAEKAKPKPIVVKRRQFKQDGEGYLTDRRRHIYVFDVARKQVQQITSGAYDDSTPVWSPDGRWLAFSSNRTSDPDANDNADVFLVEAKAGAAPRALTSSPGSDTSPVFSPDGKQIAFLAGGDPADIWYATDTIGLVAVEGGAPPRMLTAALDRNPSVLRFTADGAHILFLLEDRGTTHLARVPVAGGAVERIVTGERDIDTYDVDPKGDIVLLESQVQYPPEVSAVSGATLRRVTHVNDAVLEGIRLAPVERFRARSADGTMIDGFLTRPADHPSATRVPAVLRIHGGPVSQYSMRFSFEWQLLAAHGYAVIAANPRGSSGYGRAFSRAIFADWGNKDYDDVMAAVDHAIAMGVADPARLGVGGWSYGGILTDHVLVKTTRFKAAISGASEVNYLANYGTDHYQRVWEAELGLPWKNTALWMRLSPWFTIEKVTTPTLVMGGSDDWNVPVLNGEQLFQALKRLGRDTELVVYPGESHSIRRPSFQKDRYERYLAWYDKYLKARTATSQP
jgi:dipeptidyl aminopeptidase/acylaminoacyl peptidase